MDNRNFNTINKQPKPAARQVIFKAGARHYLHPKLAALDQIDCCLEYYPENKIIVVSFAPEIQKVCFTDYEEKIYTKTIMGTNVNYIVETISKDYITPMRAKVDSDNAIENARIEQNNQV